MHLPSLARRVRVEVLSDLLIGPNVQTLWETAGGDHFMRSWEWGQAWLQAFGVRSFTGSRLIPQIAVVYEQDEAGGEDRPIGLGPFALEPSTLVHGNRIVLIGSGKVCSDELSLLARPGKEQIVGEALADFLSSEPYLQNWDTLELDGIRTEDPAWQAFLQRLQSQSNVSWVERPTPDCWKVDLSQGWDEYAEGLSKRFRRMFRSQHREFFETGRAKLRIASNIEEAFEFLDFLEELHQKRWKRDAIEGCFSTHGFKDFLQRWLVGAWDSGDVFLGLIELDGKFVAGGLGSWGPDRLSMYLVGMDVDASESRPGWLFHQACMRLLCQRGKRWFDLLRGDEEYKLRLLAQPTPQQRLWIFAPRLQSRVRGEAIKRGLQMRTWIAEQWRAPRASQPKR